jgi:hypothetical protein
MHGAVPPAPACENATYRLNPIIVDNDGQAIGWVDFS